MSCPDINLEMAMAMCSHENIRSIGMPTSLDCGEKDGKNQNPSGHCRTLEINNPKLSHLWASHFGANLFSLLLKLIEYLVSCCPKPPQLI